MCVPFKNVSVAREAGCHAGRASIVQMKGSRRPVNAGARGGKRRIANFKFRRKFRRKRVRISREIPKYLIITSESNFLKQARNHLVRLSYEGPAAGKVDEIGFVFEQDARVFLSLFRGNGGGDRVLAIEP